MNTPLPFGKFLYRRSYLLILSAWMFTLSFVVDNYWSSNSSVRSVQKNLQTYVSRQENDFKLLLNDRELVRSIATGTFDEFLLKRLEEKPYFVFFYPANDTGARKLLCWNTQKVLPLPFMILSQNASGFVKMDNGYYVWKSRDVGGLRSVALIPVKWNYFVENDYLSNQFVNDATLSYNYDIGGDLETGLLIKSTESAPLFTIYERQGDVIQRNNPIAIGLQLLAVVCLFLFLHMMAAYLAKYRNPWLGTAVLMLPVLGLRLASYYVPVPIQLRQFEMFDPAIYGSSFLLRSLGDLLVNTGLCIWFILFARSFILYRRIHLTPVSPVTKALITLLAAASIVGATFMGSQVARSLVVDSQISFDVTDFFSLNQYSVIGFVLYALLATAYFFFCQLIIRLTEGVYGRSRLPLVFLVILLSLAGLTLRMDQLHGGFEIYVLVWLILFVYLLCTGNQQDTVNSTRLVFWMVFFSSSLSLVILNEVGRKEMENRKHYAEILAMKSDPANETLVNTMLTGFRPEFLTSQFRRFLTAESNAVLKDSLVASNTSSYTNKYDTRIYTFDDTEQPLFNEDTVSYDDINAILNTEARPTAISGLYYYDQSFGLFSYISKKALTDTAGKPIGYVFILANPRKLRSDALYPELFTRGQTNSIENSSRYAYAMYNDWRIVSSHNDYPFPSQIRPREVAGQEFTIKRVGDTGELWYYAGAGKVVIIARENNFWIESITLFSYLFCTFLLLSVLLSVLGAILTVRIRKERWKSIWKPGIRNQIHGTILLITIFSFFVVGLATILFFIARYESNNREKLSRVIRIMEREVRNTISSQWTLRDTTVLSSPEYDRRLEEVVKKISDIHGVDVNLYDLNGDLRLSSLPLPYSKGILSTRMDPLAYYHLNRKKEIQYFQKERIGRLQFISNYIPVMDERGNQYAYLNIPYYTSQNILQKEVSNFLVTIINLNAFIFLLAGLISLIISNRITSSFTIIAEKMRRIHLGSYNEAIEWKGNDEIGALVLEYNKMLRQLDESAASLARTEREGAWKEMARQVAHEIKNPLTPMKLSLQFLQKSIDNNDPNINDMAKRVSHTLIEQIDHLSHIANAFSQFASIGEAKKERFDMNELLRNVILLHESDENVRISRGLTEAPAWIEADKTQVNRLFTNLILNGIQSVQDGQLVQLQIDQEVRDKRIITRITDNGAGIPEESRAKIFTPNFTTKTSGTGLGLAMCKRIMEQSQGDIWFETKEGKGSRFYVSFPLVD